MNQQDIDQSVNEIVNQALNENKYHQIVVSRKAGAAAVYVDGEKVASFARQKPKPVPAPQEKEPLPSVRDNPEENEDV